MADKIKDDVKPQPEPAADTADAATPAAADAAKPAAAKAAKPATEKAAKPAAAKAAKPAPADTTKPAATDAAKPAAADAAKPAATDAAKPATDHDWLVQLAPASGDAWRLRGSLPRGQLAGQLRPAVGETQP